MRIPRIHVAYLLELTVLLAVAFWAVKWAWEFPGADDIRQSDTLSVRLCAWLNPMFFLLPVSGLAGMLVETVRGRRPAHIGLGRATWIVAGAYVLIHAAGDLWMWEVGHAYWVGSPSVNRASDWLRVRLVWGAGSGLGPALMATAFYRVLARVPADPEPDDREWAGRLCWLSIVGWWAAFRILKSFDL